MELNINLNKNKDIIGKSKEISLRRNTRSQNKYLKRVDSFDSFLNRNKRNADIDKSKRINIFNNINLKEEINILLHLYFMEKSIVSNFPKLNEKDKFSKLYIVDRIWIETFKKYFDYEYNIKNYLVNFDELLINDIISQILMNKTFIDTIKNNKNKSIPHLYKFLTKKKYSNIKILIDYEIINEKLYKLFNNSKYLNDKIKEVEVYRINSKKISILFKSNDFYDQLGYINKNNIFIPEYLLYIKKYNIENFEKLLNFCNNDLFKFEENININKYKIDNDIYCYKIIDDFCEKEENLNVNILSIKNDKNIKINSYCCINCDSEIEINSINICKDNEDDFIIYKCSKNCGKISVFLHEYLNKMILNIYLYRNCYICGNIQINDIDLKNNKINAFSFCFSCKKIFCNNQYCLFFHQLKCKNIKSINISTIKNICLKHSIISKEILSYTWYCIDDNKNLCDICYSEENKNHNIIYKMENAPIEINNTKEEENIFQKIIEYLKQEDNKINDNKINILLNDLNNNKNLVNLKLSKDIDILNNKRNDELSIITNKYKEYIDINKKKCYDAMTEQIIHLCKNIKTLTNNLYNKNNNNNSNDINNKQKLINNFFNEINKLEKENKDFFLKSEKDFFNEKKNFEDKYIITKKEINDKYEDQIKKIKNECNNKLAKLENEYKNITQNLENDINILQNKIKYQILFLEIILNTYEINKSNYYYKINFYNLMVYFYNDKNIFDNIILKEINNSENRDKLYNLIINKKNKINNINIIKDDNNDNDFSLFKSLNRNSNYNCAPNILNNNENEKKALINQNKVDKDEIVIKFREKFDLSEEDFPKEKILNALEKNENDFNKAFSSFFN